MNDQLLAMFLSTSDHKLPDWTIEQQAHLDTSFLETVRLHAQRVSLEGDLSTALHILEQGFVVAESLGTPLATAVIWRGRANIYQRHGQFSQSLTASNKAVAIYKTYGTPFDVAKARAIAVFVLGAMERFEEAVELAEQIRPLFEKFKLGEAVVTVNLARVYVNNWQYEKALVELKHAHHLYEQLGNEGQVGVILHDMGVAYEQLEQFETAVSHYEQSYPLLVEAKDVRTLIKNQFNRAQLSIRQADFAQALSYITQARVDTADLLESEDHAFIDLYEAQIRRQLGERAGALTLLHSALSQFEASGSQINQIEVLMELAQTVAAGAQGNDLDQAVAYLEQAETKMSLLNMPLFLAFIRLQKGEFLLRLNRLSAVSEPARSAREVFAKNNLSLRQAQAELLLADSTWKIDPDQAQELYHAAIETMGENAPSLSARCWHGLGRIALREGEGETAVVAYEKAITLLDEIRHSLHTHTHRAGFIEDKQALFGELLAALHTQNDTQAEKLFQWVERFKGQALAELLMAQPTDEQTDTQLKILLVEREQLRQELDHLQSTVNLTSSESKSILSRQRSTIQQYDQTQLKKLNQTRRQLQRLEEQIAQRQNIAHQWREGGNVISPNVHQLLDEDTILISYYTAQGQLFALTATQTSGDVHTYALNITLREIGRQWQQASRWVLRPSQNRRQVESRMGQLWQKLIAPFNAQIADKKRLLILPHRELYQIPFAALYDKNNGRYLIEQWQLQLAPSATILGWCQKRETGTAPPLLVGYPGQPEQEDYLFGVPQEIEQLQSIFPNADTLQNNEATTGNVLNQMGNRPLIHLAGHIFYNAQEPLEAGMPLADGRWLRASDLYLQYGRLAGSIVTLSGCSSGRGRTIGGDVLGLTSAFLYAGATAVIAGLWQVNDAATAKLMKLFYQKLNAGASVSDALQYAQLNLLHSSNFGHPYFWSPFQLSGGDRRIAIVD